MERKNDVKAILEKKIYGEITKNMPSNDTKKAMNDFLREHIVICSFGIK